MCACSLVCLIDDCCDDSRCGCAGKGRGFSVGPRIDIHTPCRVQKSRLATGVRGTFCGGSPSLVSCRSCQYVVRCSFAGLPVMARSVVRFRLLARALPKQDTLRDHHARTLAPKDHGRLIRGQLARHRPTNGWKRSNRPNRLRYAQHTKCTQFRIIHPAARCVCSGPMPLHRQTTDGLKLNGLMHGWMDGWMNEWIELTGQVPNAHRDSPAGRQPRPPNHRARPAARRIAPHRGSKAKLRARTESAPKAWTD